MSFLEAGLPFGDYKDFADCVSKNQDKGNPEAYCGSIKAQVEGTAKGWIRIDREDVRKACPACATKMEEMGLTVLKFESLEEVPASLRSAVQPSFQIIKADEAQHLVFGWASVAVKGDVLLTDSQGDQIEPAELEQAAYDFVEHSRVANEMHRGPVVGHLVESFVSTPEKLEAMGLMRKSAPKVGYWVGFRVEPATFQKVKSGELRMFSIEGTALRSAA